jgi:ribosomal protein S18 acetylase RimI-like enzyme
VRAGGEADAGVAATLHAGQISEGFLSFLGPRFLVRLYRRITLSPHSFLIVAEREGTTVGFIAGSTDVSGLYKSFLWHDGVRAAAGAASRVIVGWRKVLETLRHGSSGGAGLGRGGELLAVAVDPAQQARGTGRLLVTSFLDEVVARGCEAAHVVVGAHNRGAVALYERADFVIVDRFELHPGTESLIMQWDRPTSAPTSDAGQV